ncbi:MAG TPA: DNA repair protein RecO [Cytophagaceae bacterium]
MLHKTSGIVLNFIRYSESSIITKIYTEKFGLQSYIVNGVRSKSSRSKIALFQPLTILDLVVYYKQQSSIQRISESTCKFPFKSIPFDQKKVCLAIFISEILIKCLKEEIENKELFQFLQDAIHNLDVTLSEYENFHLIFLIDLAYFLGFGPSSVEDIVKREVLSAISKEEIDFINQLLNKQTNQIKTSNTTRRNILGHLLTFYQTQIENFGEVNSVEILKEILK